MIRRHGHPDRTRRVTDAGRAGGETTASGAAAVEFAILLPILVMLAFGIIGFSQAYFRSQAMNAAVREGARLAAVGDADVDAVRDAVNRALRDSGFEADDGARRGELTIPVQHFPSADVADDVPRLVSSLGDTEIPCDSSGHVRVDAFVTDETKYAIQLPLLPSRDIDFHAFAIFRCQA